VKIRVNRDALADTVAWTARVLPARPVVPVLSGLLLEAGADLLTVSAFDYEVSAQASLDAEVEEPGRVLIPGKVLAEIARRLPDEPVEIASAGPEAMLSCGSTEFALLAMPVDDYPVLPAFPERIGAVGGEAFASAVAQVAPAASRDETLPMLTGIRIDVAGETMTMAATDRYRIAARELDWRPERLDAAYAAMIPARILSEVARSLRGGEVRIALGDGIAGFECGGRRTTVRLLDEQFIDYRSRLSTTWPIRADVRTAAFAEAIRRISLVATERGAGIRLSFTDGQVVVQASGGDFGRGAEVLPAEVTGGDIEIAFQAHFLLDGLSGVDTELVRINMESPTRPALIATVPGDAAPDFRYLVMSLRLA